MEKVDWPSSHRVLHTQTFQHHIFPWGQNADGDSEMFISWMFGKSKIDTIFHDGGPYHIETYPLICSANALFYDLRHERVK